MSSLLFYELPIEETDSVQQILDGLTTGRKSISPKYFYDENGSRLFMEITRLPEYYPTRTEIALLNAHRETLSDWIGEDCLLIEFGSGSSEKIRILLESLRPRAYAPLDISREYLASAVEALASEFPWLEIHATCLDYSRDFELPFSLDARRVAFFPGSSIGNFNRREAEDFLSRARRLVGDDGGMLIGVDLKKDPEVLHAAYNDSRGVTAQFNLNVLTHLNRRFGANFDEDSFEHSAVWEPQNGCVAMYLTSVREQDVEIDGNPIRFKRGESIHTENSHKYSEEEFVDMARRSGFENSQVWKDANGWFAVIYLH